MKAFINSLPLAAIALILWFGWTKAQTTSESKAQSSALLPKKSASLPPDPAANFPEYEVVPGSVHDGDTIRARSRSGQIIKVRFACIDAPEIKQPLGTESRDYLKKLLDEAGGKVKLNITTTDRYGRSVAELWTGGGLIQSRMVAEGMAFAYDQYKKDCPHWDAVESAEQYAIDRNLGVWKNPNFQRPWDYRKSNK